MPDPLSITTGVLSLLGICAKVGWQLKQFHDATKVVDATVEALVADVDSIAKVLDALQETVRVTRSSTFQETGHIGNHWRNLSKSVTDGQEILESLHSLLERVGKTTTVLNKPRMQLRFYLAEDELAALRYRMQSYRDTVQLSLTTVILWHQVADKSSAIDVVPSLREIDAEIRRLAELFTGRIEKLQETEKTEETELDLRVAIGLRDCIHSAATVVSSASTVLGVALSDRSTVRAPSEYAEFFPPVAGFSMERWIDSRTEYSYESLEERSTHRSPRLPDVPESDSESDNELEIDIMRSLLKRGQDAFAAGKLQVAEKALQNCSSRAEALQHRDNARARENGCQRLATELLLRIYMSQSRLDDARIVLVKTVSAHGKANTPESRHDLEALVGVLLRQADFDAAHRYARQVLKAYRRLESCEAQHIVTALRLLVSISRQNSKPDHEEAYIAMLINMGEEPEPVSPPPSADISAPHTAPPDGRVTWLSDSGSPQLAQVAHLVTGREMLQEGQNALGISTIETSTHHAIDSGMGNKVDSENNSSAGSPCEGATVARDELSSSKSQQSPEPQMQSPSPHSQGGGGLVGEEAIQDDHAVPELLKSPSAAGDETHTAGLIEPIVTYTGLEWDIVAIAPQSSAASARSDESLTERRMPGTFSLTHLERQNLDELPATAETPRAKIILSIPDHGSGQEYEDRAEDGDVLAISDISSVAQDDKFRSPGTPLSSSATASCFSPVFDGSSDGVTRSTATPFSELTSVDGAGSVDARAKPLPEMSFGQVRQRAPEFSHMKQHASQSILGHRQVASSGTSPGAVSGRVAINDTMSANNLHKEDKNVSKAVPPGPLSDVLPPANVLTDWVAYDALLGGIKPLPKKTSPLGQRATGKPAAPPKAQKMGVPKAQRSIIAETQQTPVSKDRWPFLKPSKSPRPPTMPPFGGRTLPLHEAERGSLIPLSPFEPAAIRRILCCIGDGGCGKTGLLQRAAHDYFREGTGPTVSHTYLCRVEIREPSHGWVDMTLSDTGGTSEAVREKGLEACHVVVIAFDLSDLSTLENVQTEWASEAAVHGFGKPVLLVGCRSDLANKQSLEAAQALAQAVSDEIGAVAYFSTSASTGEGVCELMRHAASLAQEKKTLSPPQHARNRSGFRRSWHLRAKSNGSLQQKATSPALS